MHFMDTVAFLYVKGLHATYVVVLLLEQLHKLTSGGTLQTSCVIHAWVTLPFITCVVQTALCVGEINTNISQDPLVIATNDACLFPQDHHLRAIWADAGRSPCRLGDTWCQHWKYLPTRKNNCAIEGTEVGPVSVGYGCVVSYRTSRVSWVRWDT